MAYHITMEKIPHTIIETKSFLGSISKLWTEDEREAFIWYIALNMLEGDVIPDTGGVRKIRWASSGRGKRGGARIIYYYYNETAPLFLLYAYPKGMQVNLSEEEKKIFCDFVKVIKRNLHKKQT